MSAPGMPLKPSSLVCPWELKDVFLSLFYAFVLFFIFSFWVRIFVSALFFLSGNPLRDSLRSALSAHPEADLYGIIFFYLSLWIALKQKIFNKYHLNPWRYFFSRISWRRDVLLGLRVYLIFSVSLFGCVILVYWGVVLWDSVWGADIMGKMEAFLGAAEWERAEVNRELFGSPGLMAFALLAPFFEEIFFRGVLFGALRSHHAFFFCSIVTSLVFSFLHGYTFLFVYIFLVGLMLAHLREKTRSLTACLTAHSLNNLLAALAISFR